MEAKRGLDAGGGGIPQPVDTVTRGEKGRWLPFILSFLIIGLDHLTKWIIVKTIPIYTIGWSFGGDLFRIIHTRNKAVAFSLGSGFPEPVKLVLFIILPVVVLVLVALYLLKSDELIPLQRWALAAVVGGGIGNIIDRIFRPQGVVDFLDVKFFGLFGLERWPTFNVADSSVVIGGIVLIISFLVVGNEQKT
jgi:signal peptidase II